MTTTPNPQEDGGPAFPTKLTNVSSKRPIAGFSGDMIPPNGILNYRGMSLRDYFAAKALANAYTQCEGDPDKAAEWAYQLADAMLRARQENTNG